MILYFCFEFNCVGDLSSILQDRQIQMGNVSTFISSKRDFLQEPYLHVCRKVLHRQVL